MQLQADSFGDGKQSFEWLRTSPDFARNAIGIEVDPPRLAAALADVPLADVPALARASTGPRRRAIRGWPV